ncbi:hypothetical protein J8J40_33130, partial [Mycobacterium tuberculosis]|nr:hypothetical protein [Mycobacterium tuberculosis]
MNADGTFAATHTYLNNASYTVTAIATDDDGASSAAVTAGVAVLTVAPTIGDLVFSPAAPQEGQAVTVTGKVADPD